MKKLLLLINPTSGKRALEDDLLRVVDIFANAGYETTVYLPKSSDEMREMVMGSGIYELVVCCGGDGTLSLVSGTIYKNKIDTVMGYIPGGTTNDFAATHNIDTVATAAARNIVDGDVNNVDLGIMNGEPFAYVAAFGALPAVSYNTPREAKDNFGYAAYFAGALKTLFNWKPYHLRLEHDGEILDGKFVLGMVTNSKRIGGINLQMMKNIDYNDGLMEVTLFRAHEEPGEDRIVTFSTSNLSISFDEEVEWSLDGEYGGAFKEADIKVEKSAIKIKF